MPTDMLDEVQRLKTELEGFFCNPTSTLGPVMGLALGVGQEDGCEAEELPPTLPESEPATIDVLPAAEEKGKQVICSQCKGRGDIAADRFIGSTARLTCPLCGGQGILSPDGPKQPVREWLPDQYLAGQTTGSGRPLLNEQA